MQIFQQNKNELKGLKEKAFKLEKEIQKLVETNLEQISGYKFIKSEFIIKSNRIDTLAFDEENRSFVSPSFTDFQIRSSSFKDLSIELWEINQFENNIIVINPIKKSQSAPSIKLVKSEEGSAVSKISNEIKVYTEEDHFLRKTDKAIELYEKYKQAILNLASNIEIVPKKHYIAFKQTSNVCDIDIQKSSLRIFINMKKGTLDDPKGVTEDLSNKGHWGNGDYVIKVSDDRQLEYIMSLIKQAIV